MNQKPAPVCPDTLNLIKAEAARVPDGELARRLGWDVEKLHRVARDPQLGVTFAQGPELPVKTLEQVEAAVPAEPEPDPPPAPALSPRLAVSKMSSIRPVDPKRESIPGLSHENDRGLVFRKCVGVQLDADLRPFFRALIMLHQDDPQACLPGNYFPYSASWVSTRMKRVSDALVPLRIVVETKYGRGYRLMDVLAEKRAETAE